MGKSGAGQGATSPPAGSGMVAGLGESFSLDLNSGQGNFTIPFDLPDGVAGLKPTVKLEYSQGSGNGPFGLGWRLPLRQIDRRLDFGVPDEGTAEIFLDSGQEIRQDASGTFRAVRETTFSRYERVGDAWVVTEKDGTRYTFGATAAARVADPSRPSRIQTWLLEAMEDPHGNRVDYTYERHEEYPYLAEIRYARFAVRLQYEPRPDVLLNGRAGFLRRIARRCRAITLHLASTGRLVRTLALQYEEAPHTGISLLTAARLIAHGDGRPDVIKNPVSFHYQHFDAGRFSVRLVEPQPGDPLPPPLTDPDAALVALDDLPLPGILENSNGRHVYWPNDGAGGFGPARVLRDAPLVGSFGASGIQFADLNGDGMADMLAVAGTGPTGGYYENGGAAGFSRFVPYPRHAGAPPFDTGRIRLGDLDGDGLVDALMSTSRGLVSYVNRATAGWAEPSMAANPSGADFADALVLLADMTGDGLPDLVRIRSGAIEYAPNLGHGRFGAPIQMAGSPRLDGIAIAPEQVLLVDVDGDGVSDLVRIGPESIELYLNRSGAAFAPAIRYPTIPVPVPGTVRPVDMLAHGRSGLLYNTLRGRDTVYAYVHWPADAPPYGLLRVNNGVGLETELTYQSVVQMALADRSEGRLWDTRMPFPIWVVSGRRETDAVRGRTSDVRYRYHDGHFDTRTRRFQGFRHVDQLEVGDESRADVLTKHTFLMRQEAAGTRAHAHLDRLLSRVEIYSRDGTPLQEKPVRVEETEYDVRELDTFPDGEPRVFVFARVTRKRYLERTDDERVEERTLEYDGFGNVIRERMRGFGTEGGAAVPEKEVVTEIAYATDPAARIFRMARTCKRDAAGNLLMEVRRFYDGPAFAGLPLGQLTKGLKVREEHLALPADDFNARYAGLDAAALGYVLQPDADGRPAAFAIDTRVTYTPRGNVATETTGTGVTTEKIYDADELYVVEEITGGLRHTRVNDEVTGKPLQITAASGTTVRMEYDAFGRLVAFMMAGDTPDEPTRAIAYDDTSVPTAMHVSYRIGPGVRARAVDYHDGTGRQVQRRVERAPGDVLVSPWLLQNPWGQTKAEFEPTTDTTLAFGVPDLLRTARRTYFDGDGRPVRTVNFNGGVSTAAFAPFEITLADANDNDAAHPSAATPRRERVDVWNHRTSIVEQGDGGSVVETRFEVGLFGELLAVSDAAGTVCRYTYDRRGNRLTIDHRDAGRREHLLDSRNDVVRMRDSAGHDVVVTRDAQRRVTDVQVNGSVVERFTYDDTTPAADGRLAVAEYPGGRQQFAYDARGFLATHTVAVGADEFVLRYEHDDTGKQTAIVYPDGTRITRSHYANGLVRRIDGIVDEVVYDAGNRPTLVRYANGTAVEMTYLPGTGHLARQRTTGPGGMVLEDETFEYDLAMHTTRRRDVAPGAASESVYTYDALNQLTRVQGSDAAGAYDHAYTYHHGHNLASVGESGWLLEYGDPASIDRLTRITPAGAPVFDVPYDANGNIAALPGRTFTYDFKNHLSGVTLENGTEIRYDYDYRGNRVRRRSTHQGSTVTTTTIGRLVEVTAGQTTNFVILNRRRVALLRGGQIRWIHADTLGSAKFFSDENGTKIAEIAYHPFGNERMRQGTPALQVFALHDYDEPAGLIYMGHRWYSPQAARFLTPDPLYLHEPERSDGDPVMLRLYTYVGNNPVSRIDPEGLSFWSVVGAIVGVIVGVVVAIAVVAAFASGIGLGLLAIAGVIALFTISYAVAHSQQGTAVGEFFRGFMIGMNAGMNAAFLTMMGPVGAFLGGFVGTMIFMSSIDAVANNEIFQGILGWSNWLMPMSWLVLGLGAIMWVLNGLGHLILWEIPNLWGGGIQFFRITGFRMDWSTGMLATRGGWVGNANPIDTAYNMGSFAFVDANSTGWHLEHEAGHNLNLASFGSVFHFIGFIHEMATPAGAGALSEQLAESNDPTGTGPSIPMWA